MAFPFAPICPLDHVNTLVDARLKATVQVLRYAENTAKSGIQKKP
jgi:hypothetical protein